jgi:membrane protease YdiL (CAAX protease family)
MTKLERRSLVVFVLVSFGLSWLIALPLWLGEGLASPSASVVAVAMMSTPAVAALVVVFFVERPAHKAKALGLVPVRPVGRLIRYLVLALVVPVGLILIALPVGSLLGVYDADFVNFSGFREILDVRLAETGSAPALMIPIETLVLLQLVTVVLGAFINAIPAFGEELGWRGWLLPKLMPLGAIPAILISGVMWGLWHAPLVLLGYNYPTASGALGVIMMIGMCIIVGAIFGWLRLRSESVWPAALAHGAFNAAAGFSFIMAAAGSTVDTTQATILGWSGWIVPLIVVVVLVSTGQFRAPAQPVQLGAQQRVESV